MTDALKKKFDALLDTMIATGLLSPDASFEEFEAALASAARENDANAVQS